MATQIPHGDPAHATDPRNCPTCFDDLPAESPLRGFMPRPAEAAEDQAPAAVDRTGPLPADQVERVRAIIDGPAADEGPRACGRNNPHTPHGTCPGTAPEYPSEAVEHVAEAPAVDPAPVSLFSAEWPYPQLSAADFSAIYTAAAGHIRARGYYAYEVQGYADEPGISITGALRIAALEHVTAADPADSHEHHTRAAHDLTEELETRLSAVLYVFGQAHHRTGISDLSDVHVGWSLGHFESAASGRHTGWNVPTAAYALALLEQAARMFGHIADDTAPVTEAPAPVRM